MAEDLHAGLSAGGEKPPFAPVGHSVGGPISLIYTKQYGDEVAGLVMVDASHPEQFNPFKVIAISTENIALTAIKLPHRCPDWRGARLRREDKVAWTCAHSLCKGRYAPASPARDGVASPGRR